MSDNIKTIEEMVQTIFGKVERCEVCGDELDYVCDPTGVTGYLHCWTCWKLDPSNPKNPDNTLEKK